MKHGTVSSKRRGIQKAELGIASPRSSLNLGCFRTVGGPFGTWLGPFRDLVGVLSHGFVGVLSHGFVGVLSEAHRGKRKNNKREMQSKHRVHSLFVWLVLRTQEGCMPYRNEACNQV